MNDFLFRVCAAVAVLVFGASSTLEAAPVTFAFEAEIELEFVDPATGSVPPIPIGAGDIVKGSFLFDPDTPVISNDNPAVTVYMTELQIKLKDIEISTDSFSIEVFDDSLTIGSPGMPPVYEDFDGIRLGCSPSLPAGCQPEIIDVLGAGLFRISLELRLFGDPSVLESTEIPGSINLWNNLDSFRSLSLAFDAVDPNVATVFYGATVADLLVVPEPNTLSLTVL
ncbi:MAG: hypothetical protein GXP26_05375, partial [Planctomycetes bacterium]|nr:hypothetical protein [Planctomycetota bacterium]